MSEQSWLSRVLSRINKRPIQPSFEEYTALGQALQSGDQEMDQLILWMMKNPRLHRQFFETALFQGIEQLPESIPELEHFFAHVTQAPVWLEQDKIDAALAFTHKLGINNGFILRDLSLMAGYLYHGFNQPLMLTGALKTGRNTLG